MGCCYHLRFFPCLHPALQHSTILTPFHQAALRSETRLLWDHPFQDRSLHERLWIARVQINMQMQTQIWIKTWIRTNVPLLIAEEITPFKIVPHMILCQTKMHKKISPDHSHWPAVVRGIVRSYFFANHQNHLYWPPEAEAGPSLTKLNICKWA